MSTALFVCGAAGFPASPPELPPSSGPLNLGAPGGGPSIVPAGGLVTLTGDGFADYAAITITLYSTPTELAQVLSDDDGELSAAVELPEGLTGRHTLTAIGNDPDGVPVSLQAPVEVIAASEDSSPAGTTLGSLPRTGVTIAGMLAGGLGLLVSGFALVRTAVFRRRLLPS